MNEYNLEQLSVLVVDDNRHMRFLVRMILKSLGLKQIMEAEEGESAFKVLDKFDADIVICDWAMQPMDGIEFTKKIRTDDDSPNAYVPIIMLTGHTEVSHVVTARDAGVNEFLAKPVSAKKIYQRIKEILDNPRQYVRTPSYFGPDRRRRQDPDYKGVERRKTIAGTKAASKEQRETT